MMLVHFEYWNRFVLCVLKHITGPEASVASAISGFRTPRQLIAAGFIFLRQLTVEGYYRILHVFLSQTKCVNNKFHQYMAIKSQFIIINYPSKIQLCGS